MERIIGIDLGTTNSCVAILEGNTPVVIPNKGGYKTTPSMVAITETGKRLVGYLAKRQVMTNPKATISAAKRLIGREYASKAVQISMNTKSYDVVEGPYHEARVKLQDRIYSIPEISSMILQEMKQIAEEYLGEPVHKAVVTVPAYFNDTQRQATKEAGRIAGLEVVRMINEPTAAALAFGYGKDLNMKIAVYDLGGGTFDFSVLELSGGVFEVLATSGDTFLGGEDFDDRIIFQWLVLEFAKEHMVDLRQDKMALQRLRDAAEKAKCELSSARTAEINLPFIISKAGGETLHLQKILTRAKLEELTVDLVDRTIDICAKTLAESKVQVDEVILVGGMTRMPLVQEKVKQLFKKTPRKDVHPDEVVALGAAIQGHALLSPKQDILLLDVTPMSLGIMIAGAKFSVIIPKNTNIPTISKPQVFTTVRDHQTSVRIIVLQGEDEDATKNDLLGEFSLDRLRPAPKGEVEVEVTFQINADGIVSVSAKNLETQQAQAITVTSKGTLTEEEIQRMANENQDHLLEMRAQEKREMLRLKNQRLLLEIDKILPQVKLIVKNLSFGMDTIDKAETVIEQARKSLDHSDDQQLETIHLALSRTLEMFNNVMKKINS
jgi:molecular chaperone DnaK